MLVTEGNFTLPITEGIIVAGRREFTTSSPGTLEITVDWTHATSTIDVIVTRAICTFDQLNANQCDVVSFTRGVTPKPRRVELAGQPAGAFTLVVGNLGPEDESAVFQVVLNPSGPAVSSVRVPGMAFEASGRPYRALP